MANNPRLGTTEIKDRILTHSQNIITETFPRVGQSTSILWTSGQLRAGACPVFEGDILRDAAIFCSVLGAGVTLVRIGAWDFSSLALVASTPDMSTQFGTIGWKTASFSTPYTINSDGLIILGLVCVFSTTGPTVASNGTASGFATASPPGVRDVMIFGGTQANLTDPLTKNGAMSNVPYIMAY